MATEINNIEIVGNQDDGVEWFGGTVDVQNVVVWNCGDDGIDTDQSWSGTLDNFVVIGATGHAFELDGPEGSFEDGHTIMNGSVKMQFTGANGLQRTTVDIINVDDNSIVDLQNIYFTNLASEQMVNSVDAEGVTFENIYLDVPSGEVQDYVNGDVPAGITSGNSPQADVSVFNWTWTSQAGALSGL
jgi:hypothetical protein